MSTPHVNGDDWEPTLEPVDSADVSSAVAMSTPQSVAIDTADADLADNGSQCCVWCECLCVCSCGVWQCGCVLGGGQHVGGWTEAFVLLITVLE